MKLDLCNIEKLSWSNRSAIKNNNAEIITISLKEIEVLLNSKVQEERLIALLLIQKNIVILTLTENKKFKIIS